MDSISIFQKAFSDGSKSWFLRFWQNEAELKLQLEISSKQYHILKKEGFPVDVENSNT